MIKLRKKIKSKKPKFTRTDSNKYKFKNKWRKPRGLQNKLRLNKKGHKKKPSKGYKSPRKVRGLTRDGLNPIMISNVNELKKDIPIIISKTVGKRNKIIILEKAKELNIKVTNVKNVDEFIKKAKEEKQKKKIETKKKEEKKKKSKEEAIKKAEEKKKSEETPTEEEKQEIEKKEEQKILQKEQPKIKQTKQQIPKQPKVTDRSKSKIIPGGEK